MALFYLQHNKKLKIKGIILQPLLRALVEASEERRWTRRKRSSARRPRRNSFKNCCPIRNNPRSVSTLFSGRLRTPVMYWYRSKQLKTFPKLTMWSGKWETKMHGSTIKCKALIRSLDNTFVVIIKQSSIIWMTCVICWKETMDPRRPILLWVHRK